VDSIVMLIGRRGLAAALAAWLTLGSGIGRPRAETVAIAVVVNPSNVEQGMTSAELCDTLLGERRRWANGSLIQVFVPPAGSQEWTVILRAVCRTSEAGFRRQVASSRAFGHASRPPQVVATASEMKQRVAASPRAIGFVTTSQLDRTVKTLSIDGLSPTDTNYPIQASTQAPPR
jgi:ABC-type phosphate transport system substrate-binding protein